MENRYYNPGTIIEITGSELKREKTQKNGADRSINGIPAKIYNKMWNNVIRPEIKQGKSVGAILSNVKQFLLNNGINIDADPLKYGQLIERIKPQISSGIDEKEIEKILNHDDLDTEILYFLSKGVNDEEIIKLVSKIPNLEKSSDELQVAVNDMREVLEELIGKLDECAKNRNTRKDIYTCNPRLIRGFIMDVLSTNSHLRERLYRPRCIITYMTEVKTIEENKNGKTKDRKVEIITPDVITVLYNYIILVRDNKKNKENKCDRFRHRVPNMGTTISADEDSQGKTPTVEQKGDLEDIQIF